jgi:hypothetical protein
MSFLHIYVSGLEFFAFVNYNMTRTYRARAEKRRALTIRVRLVIVYEIVYTSSTTLCQKSSPYVSSLRASSES